MSGTERSGTIMVVKSKGKAAGGEEGRSLRGDESGAAPPSCDRASRPGTPLSCRICGVPSISRRAFLKSAMIAGAMAPLAGCGEADIGWLAQRLVSPEAEAELGQQAFQQIASQTPVAQDSRLHAYVGRIGKRIVEASKSPYPEWAFTVFEGTQANAFALPGGRVGVFTGMLKVAANEDQLAAVLGHEVGHVNARHGAERLVAEQGIAWSLRLGAMLLSLGDVPIPPDLVVALGASAAEFGIVRPFSRRQELEADVLGLGYMAEAGYRPREAITFWRRMQQQTSNGGVPPFLATHPSSAQRIEALLKRLPELERNAGWRSSVAALTSGWR